ncbi:unnamed protein product [Vitrella brassicaformis CCMP3155]|uniref:formate C-acetyltransferase n=2 Tax=Vitrella brassicaformis TaxID=1169539 RepID=A0A0G4EPX2_VITBC|nr:unnamed protein product [Vitrella brassicaformis CCMP3155]|mmetsp:Transcript_27942/g.69734  ORF Transcript_27942/g.69734 Transcript_27942/m.69734 type:complete len:734 (+) Transcript_27942:115-2316(+)|eukprot:CEL99900.1 unnamed protein product [Vitrella brassicaformis CCMP3155]
MPAPVIDVEAYISQQLPTLLYDGDGNFLAGPTDRTKKVWTRCTELLKEELAKGGTLDVDNKTISYVNAFGAGYIDRENELIVGLQADAPLKRTCKPHGGIRMVQASLESVGSKLDPLMEEIFTKHRKTHNQGVFDVYDDEMRACRSAHILTGLPDSYGRGRIIGDYRRVALYGIDLLIEAKKADKKLIGPEMNEDNLRLREEISEQILAFNQLKEMGMAYGIDMSKPAQNAQEAIQFTYFAYLGAIKEQDGAAMSLGRMDSFFETYISKDLEKGSITEERAQELIDDFVIKLRLVRHLRTPAFEDLFSGNPTWVTAVIGGIDDKGTHQVTKTSFRILNTLYNLGPAPEPNMTVLWSQTLPKGFKEYCAKVSIDTSSIQYENDDVMRPVYGADYAIACCVSGMTIGKQMQFFGARCNLPKLLLYTLNEGRDEISGKQVGPKFKKFKDGPLDFAEVQAEFEKALDWLMRVYANTMNCIHYMHDKYFYERLEMALHDSNVHRFMAYGIAGISVMADSLSAIRDAKVTPVRDERGITTDFKIEGEFPKYGNDDDRVDELAKWVTKAVITRLRQHKTYRNSEPTLSVLTITSNVVYGKATGSTPDGRKKGEPFAPGANPMHGRDASGALASLNSVAKLDYSDCRDGISNTFSLVPTAIGKDETARKENLTALLDGYFGQMAHHLNVNVLNRDTLLDAVEHPEKYPQLTVRVSGYAVHFNRLTRDQQMEVIGRTFHTTI